MGHMYSFNFKASKDIPSDIEVLNRGLLYGDGFFETINYTNQKIPLFTYHFQRIKLAHEAFGLTLQVSEEQLLAHLIELCDGKKEARIKIIFWRSSGGFYSPTSTASEVFIQVSNKTPMSLHKKKAVIYTGARNSLSTTSGFKTLSALKYVMAGKYMKDHEAEDVLLLDEKDQPSEMLYSNIFWIKDEKLFTPSLKTGCIQGTMRSFLLKEFPVEEGLFPMTHLNSADCVFTTNAMGLIPIEAIENTSFGNSNPLLEKVRASLPF